MQYSYNKIDLKAQSTFLMRRMRKLECIPMTIINLSGTIFTAWGKSE